MRNSPSWQSWNRGADQFERPVRTERWNPASATAHADLEALAAVLHACVHAGASVSFVLPFSHDDAKAFWRDQVLPAVHAGTRRVILARLDAKVVGTVQLDLATPPNQPHRVEVRKLLVHPGARRRGIARALMMAAEEQALEAHRDLLTLGYRDGWFCRTAVSCVGLRCGGRDSALQLQLHVEAS